MFCGASVQACEPRKNVQEIKLKLMAKFDKYRNRVRLIIFVFACLSGGFVAYRNFVFTSESVVPLVDLTGAPDEMAELILASQSLVNRQPSSADAWTELAARLLANRFFVQAAHCYEAAIRLEAGWERHYLHGIALESVNATGAQQAFEEAVLLHQEYPPVYARLALCHEAMGEDEFAARDWRRVLELEPKNYAAQLGLARIAMGKNNLQEARQAAQQAVLSEPSQREAHILLIQIFSRLGNQFKAAEHQQLLADCRGTEFSLHDPILARVEAFQTVHEFVRVSREADRAVREGDLQAMIVASEKLVELQPNYATPAVNLGTAIGDLGQAQKAIELLQEATQQFPESARAHLNLGLILARSGQMIAARSSLERAVQVKPDYAQGYLYLGFLLQESQELEAASHAFRQALAARPDFTDAHLGLAQTLQSLGDREEAKKHYRLVLKFRAGDVTAQRALALLGE